MRQNNILLAVISIIHCMCVACNFTLKVVSPQNRPDYLFMHGNHLFYRHQSTEAQCLGTRRHTLMMGSTGCAGNGPVIPLGSCELCMSFMVKTMVVMSCPLWRRPWLSCHDLYGEDHGYHVMTFMVKTMVVLCMSFMAKTMVVMSCPLWRRPWLTCHDLYGEDHGCHVTYA